MDNNPLSILSGVIDSNVSQKEEKDRIVEKKSLSNLDLIPSDYVFDWYVVPEVKDIEKKAVDDIARFLNMEIPSYAVFIDVIVNKTDGMYPTLSFRYYEIKNGELEAVAQNKVLQDLLKGTNVWIIYNSSNMYAPYYIKQAWESHLKSGGDLLGEYKMKLEDLTKKLQEIGASQASGYLMGILAQELWKKYGGGDVSFINTVVVSKRVSKQSNVIFVSDQFPPEGEGKYFNVKPYKEFPRKDIVLAEHTAKAFEGNSIEEIRNNLLESMIAYLDKDPEFVVTDNVKDVLRIIISYLFVNTNASPALGKILLIGPPGTGKTTFAKKIGEALFGTQEVFDRVDMNSFSGTANDREALRHFLIGASGEYRAAEFARGPIMKLWGYRRGVILWDEIDKAGNPASKGDILNFLMQVLEEDYLQMAFGGKVPIYNFVHIFTANRVGGFRRPMGLTQKYSEREEYMKSIKEFVPEAFLSRIDKVIYYGYPTRKELEFIVKKLVDANITEWLLSKDPYIKEKITDYLMRKIDENIISEKETGITPRVIKRWLRDYLIGEAR